jgi:hypothetical protein
MVTAAASPAPARLQSSLFHDHGGYRVVLQDGRELSIRRRDRDRLLALR